MQAGAYDRLIDLVGPGGYVHGWIKVSGPGAKPDAAAKYHGQDGIRGDLGGGKGVVMGKYDHAGKTITDRNGVSHSVQAIDPTAHEAGFKGDVATSHLPAGAKQGIMDYEKATKSGAVQQLLQQTYRGPKAQAGASKIQFAGKHRRVVDMAQPKLGSGDRFAKLSATLAARGASNPDALAAWIGRRKYGAKKMGGLSHHSHANQGSLLDILLADTGYDNSEMKCPNCGYQADSAKFAINGGASGTSDAPSSSLQTPDGGNVASSGFNSTQGVDVSSGTASGALSNTGRRSIMLASGTSPRLKVNGPFDFIVSRSADDPSVANVRHRRGGDMIGQLRKDDGGWRGVIMGQEMTPHTQQRAALMELLGAHNRGVVQNGRPSEPVPYQAGPVQTPLMQQLGIPAVRTFATPATGASSGPRITLASADSGDDADGSDNADGSDSGGLTAKGQAIYKKLLAKGFPAARAMAFAKRAQNMTSGSFKKAS